MVQGNGMLRRAASVEYADLRPGAANSVASSPTSAHRLTMSLIDCGTNALASTAFPRSMAGRIGPPRSNYLPNVPTRAPSPARLRLVWDTSLGRARWMAIQRKVGAVGSLSAEATARSQMSASRRGEQEASNRSSTSRINRACSWSAVGAPRPRPPASTPTTARRCYLAPAGKSPLCLARVRNDEGQTTCSRAAYLERHADRPRVAPTTDCSTDLNW